MEKHNEQLLIIIGTVVVFRRQLISQVLKSPIENVRFLQRARPEIAFLIYLTVASSMLLLLHFLETSFGLDKRTHIDSQTYIDKASGVCKDLIDLGIAGLPNRAMYCVVDVLGENGTIFLNSALVAFSSALMMASLFKRKLPIFGVLAVLAIILAPYRLHLGIHLLKDSFIQFFVCMAVFSKFGSAWLVPLVIFRPGALIYAPSLFRLRYFAFILLLSVLGVYLLFPGGWALLLQVITEGNNLQFVFQEYDNIPTFQQFGPLGDLLRALVWPALLLTGAFFVISPAALFVPIAFTSLCTLGAVYVLRTSLNWEGVVLVYLGVAAIAYIAPGFTGFIRYSYPLVTVVLVSALLGRQPLNWRQAFCIDR